MANEKIYTQPKLYPTNRSLKKTWLVEFRYLNPDTGKMQTKQFRDNLNELKTVKERLTRGKVLCQSFTDLLAESIYKKKISKYKNLLKNKHIDQIEYEILYNNINKTKLL